MALLTTAQVREHIETDLKDDALTRLIEDADAQIVEVAGELNTETDTKIDEVLANALFLNRRASSITTVVEEVKQGDGSYYSTTLAADDYTLRSEGRIIERLATGTNPRTTWGDTVTITYVPYDTSMKRERVLIDLVKLAVQYNALDSEKVGDYSASQSKYTAKRQALLKELREWSMA